MRTVRPSALVRLAVTILVGVAMTAGCSLGAAPPVRSAANAGGGMNGNAERPNVLVIVTDDQGYADYSAFAHHAPGVRTPNMDRVAEEGALFTQAYATAPVCSPSRAGLNTGRYQFRWDERAAWSPGLPGDVRTLAERLRQAGYRTARIGKNDYGDGYHRHDVREYPLNHGYDTFLGFSAHAQDYWLLSEEMDERTPDPNGNSANLGPLMQGEGSWKSYDDAYATDIFTDAAVDFLRRNRAAEQPFFLTLSYSAVHHLVHEVPADYLADYDVEPIPPYDPSRDVAFEDFEPGSYKAYYEKYSRIGAISSEEMRQFHLANLHYLDDNVGRVLDAMDALGLAENTLVVLVSDNGGSPLASAVNAPLTGGKFSLYEGGIRVPFAVRWPERITAGQVYEHPVSALDIAPTVLEAADARAPQDTLDGVSLLDPVASGRPAGGEKRTLFWRWRGSFAVRQGDWKLTNVGKPQFKAPPSDYYIKPKYDTREVRLFNLEDDPEEAVDVAGEHPEVVRRLYRRYRAWKRDNTGRY